MHGLILGLLITPPLAADSNNARVTDVLSAYNDHPRVHSLIVARDGEIILEEVFRGPDTTTPVNIKSLAKTFMGALTGAALHQGLIDSMDTPVVSLLGERLPDESEPQLQEVTLAHLLTMSSGLQRTSGGGYGAWVNSANWVEHALTRPFVEAPGEAMQYSTGDFHILGAALTQASGQTLLALSREWIGGPLNIRIPAWDRDPQGIYFGGNNMRLSPRALLQLGELYRNDGVSNGERVLAEGWVETSWTPRVRSPWSGDDYGFGWFIRQAQGLDIYYGRGYGGQMLYVIPELALTVVITADPTPPSDRGGDVDRLHHILEQQLIPALREEAQNQLG
ncbi:CubicO group peptidase (beta-lactamase class C family) [Natronospira proteinivora]|uniref:CubicO group peptidase (Beta-lactamase class C family) n=1 Tax=Natronospira proteinivora TaxID=1807133 RepID=A0ABT1G8C1_9GAMM|nr:serine hydrolase [Natronospira proteinivora]MCP1726603.1 CubicO group peptidase (beta-lactamase class C family) [Natronospira proteinivora]